MSIGVLVMAYGGPDQLEDVEPYLLDVRGGRATAPAIVEEVRERYRQIGGRSPILAQTNQQAAALQQALDRLVAFRFRTFVGMRHWTPYIGPVVERMRTEQIKRVVGIVMAPHYSGMSIGAYERKLVEAASGLAVAMVRSWGLLPGYLDALERNLRAALARVGADEATRVLLTAHSLPERILATGDPYKTELLDTVAALQQRLPALHLDFAFQSAAMTSEPWLGPDAGAVVREWAAAGVRRVVVCAIGFVTEHVEILYDLDIELQRTAGEVGIRLERAPMVGADPGMMDGLAELVRAAAAQKGWQ